MVKLTSSIFPTKFPFAKFCTLVAPKDVQRAPARPLRLNYVTDNTCSTACCVTSRLIMYTLLHHLHYQQITRTCQQRHWQWLFLSLFKSSISSSSKPGCSFSFDMFTAHRRCLRMYASVFQLRANLRLLIALIACVDLTALLFDSFD